MNKKEIAAMTKNGTTEGFIYGAGYMCMTLCIHTSLIY